MTPGLIFAPGESGRYRIRTSDLCDVISSPDETKPTELIPDQSKKLCACFKKDVDFSVVNYFDGPAFGFIETYSSGVSH